MKKVINVSIVTYPGPGCLVEYMEANAPQIALVTEEQGGKLRLLLPNRRETKIGINRLLPWSGPIVSDISSKEKNIQFLEEHRGKRKNIAEGISSLDVWELSQGEVEKATAQWFAELFVQDPCIDTIVAYGHVLLHSKNHFRFQNPHFEVFTDAIVQARLKEQNAQRERDALIGGGAAFFRILWDVWTKKRQLPTQDSDEYPTEEVAQVLEKILRSRIADPEGSEFELIWRSLIKGLPEMQHMALHLATAWGLVKAHHNFWLDRAGYATGDTWHDKYAKDIQSIVDLTHQGSATLNLPFISIDSATTKDIDDAFYVEKLNNGNYRLQLALACPALMWPFGSKLDKVVMQRATSLYLPEDTYHMMPEILGINAFSLLEKQLRPSLLVCIDVDSEGKIVSCSPSVEWLTIEANLTYEACEEVLEGNIQENNPCIAYKDQIILGEELSILRQKHRIASGAVVMDRPDNKIILEEVGENVHISIEDPKPTPRAQLLVSEMMVLASTALATWSIQFNIPLLFRTQDVAIPREYAGIWTKPQDMARIIRTLVPSILELSPKPHAGLGVRAYAPVTSPLRRYSDLLNEAQIIFFLEESTVRWQKEDLEILLNSLQLNNDAVTQVQRFRPRYWRLQYMRQEGDKKWWPAIITEENDNFVTVSLPHEQLSIRGRRHLFGERAIQGQEILVRIGKVNPVYNEIFILETMEM